MTSMVFVHKFVHHRHTLPDVFYNNFISNSLIHNYTTRQKVGLHLFSVNTASDKEIQSSTTLPLCKDSKPSCCISPVFQITSKWLHLHLQKASKFWDKDVRKCPGARFTKDL